VQPNDPGRGPVAVMERSAAVAGAALPTVDLYEGPTPPKRLVAALPDQLCHARVTNRLRQWAVLVHGLHAQLL